MYLSKRSQSRVKRFLRVVPIAAIMAIAWRVPAVAQNAVPPLRSLSDWTIERSVSGRVEQIPSSQYHPIESNAVLLWNDRFCDASYSLPTVLNCSNDLEGFAQRRTELESRVVAQYSQAIEVMGLTLETYIEKFVPIRVISGYRSECLFLENGSDTEQLAPLSVGTPDNTSARYYNIRLVTAGTYPGLSEPYQVVCSIHPDTIVPILLSGSFSDITAAQAIAQISEPGVPVQSNESVTEIATTCINEYDSESSISIAVSENCKPCDAIDEFDLSEHVYLSSRNPESDPRFSDKWHSYEKETVICSTTNPLCTREAVYEWMLSQKRFAVPFVIGNEQYENIKNCSRSELRPQRIISYRNLPVMRALFDILRAPDPVVTLIDENIFSATNYTLEEHSLHPGRITRSVVEENGDVLVRTTGIGTGPYKGTNKVSGPIIFGNLDQDLKDYVEEQIDE